MNIHNRENIKNHLLLELPDEDLERVLQKLTHVDLPAGKSLFHPHQTIEHIYFPKHSMISVVAYTETGQGSEVAVIGVEGAAGISALFGAESTPYESMAQLPDGAFQMKIKDAREEFERGGAFQRIILRFASRLLVQISQTSLCNRVHSVEKRLSRWLLMCRDRYETDTMPITHEFLAIMLGSNRTSVSLTAAELQRAGLIAHTRGRVHIRDRYGLEQFACSCYRVIADEYGIT